MNGIMSEHLHRLCPLNPSRPEPGRRKKINLNFNFHTFFWFLKRFYKCLERLHKTFLIHYKEMQKLKLKLFSF